VRDGLLHGGRRLRAGDGDESIIVKNQATIFLGGPPLVKAATGEVVSAEDLGGADVHTGCRALPTTTPERRARAGDHARIVANLNRVKPASLQLRPPRPPLYDPAELHGLMPADLRQPYDVREVIARRGRRLAASTSSRPITARRWSRALPASLRHAGRHHRQQRRAVFRKRAEGGAFHRAVLPAQDPADVPAEHHRLHGGSQIRDGGIAKDGAKLVTAVASGAGAEDHGLVGGSFGAGNYGMCGPGLLAALPVDVAELAHLGDGGRAGGHRARHVRRDNHRAQGRHLAGGGGSGVQAPILDQFETEGQPLYASARLWDDGIIDPARTREVLALSLSAALNRAVEETKFGLFRM
jgi:3-methylcrotonyl-CoA carboxylase beta subunit